MLFNYLEQPDFPPLQYVTPGGPMAIVRAEKGERHFTLVRWGLVPSWVKEIKPGKPLINARADSVLVKASFRNAMKRRRCLIPADGFYEWTGDIPGKKQPWFVRRPDDGLFAFAGLWEYWMGADGSELETAVIITGEPNETVSRIHNRMPSVIAAADYSRWLDVENVEPLAAASLLKPVSEDFFIVEPTRIERKAPPPKPKAEPPAPQMKII